ncbi:MAG: hypothetical protein V1904_09710 [Bacteroidota bacterium]
MAAKKKYYFIPVGINVLIIFAFVSLAGLTGNPVKNRYNKISGSDQY